MECIWCFEVRSCSQVGSLFQHSPRDGQHLHIRSMLQYRAKCGSSSCIPNPERFDQHFKKGQFTCNNCYLPNTYSLPKCIKQLSIGINAFDTVDEAISIQINCATCRQH